MDFPIVAGVEFKSHPRFPHYAIGNNGEVWSLYGKDARLGNKWKKLRGSINKEGYHCYRLRDLDGDERNVTAHKAVLIAFCGDRPAGMQCCHGNGNKLDNRLENLRWDTAQANVDDRQRHGRTQRGSRHYLAKLTEESVSEIRNRSGESFVSLARQFGVTPHAIRCIVHRRTWKHVA